MRLPADASPRLSSPTRVSTQGARKTLQICARIFKFCMYCTSLSKCIRVCVLPLRAERFLLPARMRIHINVSAKAAECGCARASQWERMRARECTLTRRSGMCLTVGALLRPCRNARVRLRGVD
eukprot:6189586-Pleurochrysis_carterae.AAC.3